MAQMDAKNCAPYGEEGESPDILDHSEEVHYFGGVSFLFSKKFRTKGSVARVREDKG